MSAMALPGTIDVELIFILLAPLLGGVVTLASGSEISGLTAKAKRLVNKIRGVADSDSDEV
jgi:hypothetical protein